MKYCTKCGADMEDQQNLCAACSVVEHNTLTDDTTQQEISSQEAPPRQLKKGTKVAILLLLMLTIVLVVSNAVRFFIASFLVDKAELVKVAIDEVVFQFPELEQVVDAIDTDTLRKVVDFAILNVTFLILVPLFWVLPMRKKIVAAMRTGGKLSKPFKICTLIFVNLIAGIILLNTEDI